MAKKLTLPFHPNTTQYPISVISPPPFFTDTTHYPVKVLAPPPKKSTSAGIVPDYYPGGSMPLDPDNPNVGKVVNTPQGPRAYGPQDAITAAGFDPTSHLPIPGPGAHGGFLTSIFDDPMYGLALQTWLAHTTAGRSTLRDSLQRAVIQSGYIPKFSAEAGTGDLAGYADDLDQNTINFANQNPNSVAAQQLAAYKQNLINTNYQLAARGLRGGANVSHTGYLTAANDRQTTANVNNLIDAIRGYAGTYQTLLGSEDTAFRNAIADIGTRLASTPGPVYAPSTAGGNTAVLAAPSDAEPDTGPLGTVTWGGRQFTSKADLTAFLNSIPYGLTPAQWAAFHPTAWAGLK